jgi:hypothetical protein
MKYFPIPVAVCGACIALLLVTAYAVQLAGPNPVEAAKAKLVAEGWQEQDLVMLSCRISTGPFRGTGYVEFQVKGSNQKTIRVELRRTIYSLKWQVTGYKEDVPKPK